jgi:hypothetical protein
MIIEYLPSHPKYRAFVERALEFLQQVYKDQELRDLRFIAYNIQDVREEREVVEKFHVREHIRGPYYDYLTLRAVIVASTLWSANDVFEAVVEEVSHHVLKKENRREVVIRALLRDIPRLRFVGIRRVDTLDRIKVAVFIDELHVQYVVYNYFVELKSEPVTVPRAYKPTRGYISFVYETVGIREKGLMADVAKIVYDEVIQKGNSLPNFREAVHSIFTGVVKKLPAEVYNSNPSRYEILYRRQRIDELPL